MSESDQARRGYEATTSRNAPRPEAVEEIRKATAKRRREAGKQMTPDAEPDNTIEGEGSIGLSISGGANG